ncbi:MAG: ATP-binding protein [Caulobacteraceae bacterium]|nr:ATP-binding protein [Caulobacteraceae bacterium]
MTAPETGPSVEGSNADPNAAARDYLAMDWSKGLTPPTLSQRLDDAAALVHPVSPVKAALNVVGGLMAAMILPPMICIPWVLGGVLLETWGWFATRRAFLRRPVDWRGRALFIANYVWVNLWWLALGALFWNTGTLQGQASAMVLFLAIVSVFVMLFHTAPLTFLIAGSFPAIAALAVVAIRDEHGWREFAPIWIALGLSMIFNLGRALETPSAQASKQLLNDSLNKYRILAENVTDIITRMDLDGIHQYVSPGVFEVLGYRPEELVGTSRADLLHPDCLAMAEAVIDRMQTNPDLRESITLRVRHKDGRWRWLQSSGKIVWEKGVPVALIDVSRDVTDRVAADAALLEAKAEAESATRAKAEFLANVSHEIRTPMNGILGALHLLEREPISADGRELMRQASDCGRMLSQLLNDVLDFSKIEAGQLDLNPEPVDIGEAVRSVTALLAAQARAKGVDLSLDIVGERFWIQADPVRLRQAVFNLVGNAVKFTAKGHVAVRLTVEPLLADRVHVRLEVEDSGIGMTREAQSHLFERFRQAESDTSRRFGGTGLGLSITQALARMMGGEISFSSVEGEGSTFWLDFEAPAADPVASVVVEDELLSGLNVLLVEDNPTNRLVARTMLARLGARITEAEDGLAGVEAARSGRFDLILMDVQMPRMDGVEATGAIRALPGPASAAPIIGLTANVMVHQQAVYFAAGMNAVVAKPISPASLLAAIATLVRGEGEARPTALAS